MDKETKELNDTARVLNDLLKACFGTTMIEPGKWQVVSTALPSRRFFRNFILSGSPAFCDSTIEVLKVLLNAAFRIGEDSSSYDGDHVARSLAEHLKDKGWGDFGKLGEKSGTPDLDKENRKILIELVSEIAVQLFGKTDVSEEDRNRIRNRLCSLERTMSEKVQKKTAPAIDLRQAETISASVDLLMKGLDLPDEKGFLKPEDEQNAWKALSNTYCGGIKIDTIIQSGLDLGLFDRYGAQIEVMMRHFASKFNLKRGKVEKSNNDLGRLTRALESNRSKIDGTCILRMSALAEIRKLTNNAVPSAEHVSRFEFALGSLKDLRYCSDGYKAYETASAIGAEVTNALAKGPASNGPAIAGLEKLTVEHSEMIEQFPEQLGNQQVVAISLRWFMELSKLAGKPASDRNTRVLFGIAVDGLQEARIRKNSLFHIQCVMVISICAMCEGHEDLFFSLGFIVAKLKNAFGIKETQEGVWQLISIMNYMKRGSSKKLLADPNQQMNRMKDRRSPLIGWTMSLDSMYRNQVEDRKQVYKVDIENEILKLEAFPS